jgi:hypothetical protein
MNTVARAVLIIFILALVVIFLTRPSPARRLGIEAARRNLLTDYMRDDVQAVLPILVRNTRFADKWRINDAPKSGVLSVYLLKPGFERDAHISRSLAQIAGNCAWLGDDIIICDTWLFSSFIARSRIDFETGHPEFSWRTMNTQWFIFWVLGHELGHAVAGHSARSFAPGGLEHEVATASFDQREEFAADRFLLEVMRRDKQLEFNVVRMMIDILHSEISFKTAGRYERPRSTYGGQIAFQGVVEYSREGNHPEFIIRIARILSMVG